MPSPSAGPTARPNGRGVRPRREPIEPDDLPASVEVPNDFAEALERELAALPEDYRAALLLCDVQGHSPEEASRALGWGLGQLRRPAAPGRGRSYVSGWPGTAGARPTRSPCPLWLRR